MYYSSTIKYEISHTLTERFVHTYGFEKEGVWFYPTPKRTAAIEVEELRNLQFSQRKTEYLIGLSKMIAAGELNLHDLATKPDGEITKTLVKIRGV